MKRKRNDEDDRTEKDLKRKQHDDPLNLMRALTGDKHHKKHKKDKDERKSKREDKSRDEKQPTTSSGKKTIEELRAERFDYRFLSQLL